MKKKNIADTFASLISISLGISLTGFCCWSWFLAIRGETTLEFLDNRIN
jgi:hypothetical protein